MLVDLAALLDDLDKELNNYIMRVREWYGWHFPELGKIVMDNLVYSRVVKLIGQYIMYINARLVVLRKEYRHSF